MEYFEYRFGYKYNFSRNDKFGNFKKLFCFVFEFYGIDGKYFDGTEMFENKLILFLCIGIVCLPIYIFIHK